MNELKGVVACVLGLSRDPDSPPAREDVTGLQPLGS